MSNAVPDVETGLPIVKTTQCKVGTHVVVYTGSQPSDWQRCECGLTKWNPVTRQYEPCAA